MKAAFMEKWLLLSGKVEALNQRERLVVFGAAALLTYSVIHLLLLDPLETSKKRLQAEISTDRTLALELQQQVDVYKNKLPIDPDAQNKQRIAELQAQLYALKSAQNQLDISLVSPDKMPALLRDLLAKNGKLKLISLDTLPTQNLIEPPSPPAESNTTQPQASPVVPNQVASEDSTLFKHGVEITVEGRYLDLLEYVAAIENMHWHVLWNDAELSTKAFPNNRLKLTVYTLSLDKTWLSI